MKTAACYIRVSTDDQVEYSPDSQLREIRDYCKKNDLQLLDDHIYADEGISGKRADKRPKFQQMISDAKSIPKPFDILLVYSLSRFARSREDSVVYKVMLRKKCNIDIISITEPIGDMGKMGFIVESFIEGMDEYYLVNLAENVKRGMTEKAMRGELQSVAPYGYTIEKNVLVRVPEEAAIIKEIFNRFISGEGCFPIARWLNSLELRTHRGNKFENRTVEYIINNPVYVGKNRWCPSGAISRNYNHPDVLIVDGKHQSTITDEQWDLAQKQQLKNKSKQTKKSRPTSEYKEWVSGLIKCSACGGTLNVDRIHNILICGAYCKGACKTSNSINIDLMKKTLIDRLSSDSEILSKKKRPTSVQFTVINTAEGVSEEEQLTKLLDKIPAKILRAREAYTNGIDSIEEYKENKVQIEADEKKLRERLAAMQLKKEEIDTVKLLRNNIKNTLVLLQSDKAPLQDKINSVQTLIKTATFDKAKNTLTMQYKVLL